MHLNKFYIFLCIFNLCRSFAKLGIMMNTLMLTVIVFSSGFEPSKFEPLYSREFNEENGNRGGMVRS